jgi:GDP-L-fucose synthase
LSKFYNKPIYALFQYQMIHPEAKVYVAGHTGMVGSAILRKLQAKGYKNILVQTSAQLDLRNQSEVHRFFEAERPEYVFLAAAKVGGILANDSFRADFLYDNLSIQTHVIHAAHLYGVKKLLFLGSSCIYPKMAPQPIQEESLLTGPLEPTNEPYAIAKIAGIKLCENYFRQYGNEFISIMPTNLYGPGDNYHLHNSHVLPAMIRKMHLAQLLLEQNWEAIGLDLQTQAKGGDQIPDTPDQIRQWLRHNGIIEEGEEVLLQLWGSGEVYREFLFVDELADACVFAMREVSAMQLYRQMGVTQLNVGSGVELSVRELAEKVKIGVGFKGKLAWDKTKPDGTPRKLLDSSRINSLGWKATLPLEQGIALTYESYVRQLSPKKTEA